MSLFCSGAANRTCKTHNDLRHFLGATAVVLRNPVLQESVTAIKGEGGNVLVIPMVIYRLPVFCKQHFNLRKREQPVCKSLVEIVLNQQPGDLQILLHIGKYQCDPVQYTGAVTQISTFNGIGNVLYIPVTNLRQYVILATVMIVKSRAVDARNITKLTDGDFMNILFFSAD